MSKNVDFAKNELTILGWLGSDDEMSDMMAKNVLELLEVMSTQGHSGFSASYLINFFTRLANWKPLSPLTGEDSEWHIPAQGDDLYQNLRYPSVFKQGKNGVPHDNSAKVFWEWAVDSEGVPYKSYYSGSGCSVDIEFPYTVPDKPIYEYKYSDASPQCPPQNEQGIF